MMPQGFTTSSLSSEKASHDSLHLVVSIEACFSDSPPMKTDSFGPGAAACVPDQEDVLVLCKRYVSDRELSQASVWDIKSRRGCGGACSVPAANLPGPFGDSGSRKHPPSEGGSACQETEMD